MIPYEILELKAATEFFATYRTIGGLRRLIAAIADYRVKA